ncbi:MAG: hypothetical protein ACRCVK_19795 [Aeromonas veronii]
MITLSPKDPTETISISLDYAPLLADAETIASASISLAVLRGTDPDAGTMLVGGAVIDSPVVSHLVRNGVDSVDYLVSCLATTTLGQILKISGILPVRVQA